MYKKLLAFIRLDLSLPNLLGHNRPETNQEEEDSEHHEHKVTEKSVSFVDSVVNFIFSTGEKQTDSVLGASRGPLLLGLAIVVTFFGFFGAWAAIAPLEGAVIAVGEVMSSLNKQIVQHLEGGMIKEILVKEGEVVKKGQPLLLLNDTAARANLDIMQEKILVLLSTTARLKAIKHYRKEVTFPNEVYNLSSTAVVDRVIQNQKELFRSYRKSISGQMRILRKRIKQLEQELSGLSAQLESEEKQYSLITEELETKKSLLAGGYISKPYILNLERLHAEAQGKLGRTKAAVASTQQKIGETQLEIINIANSVQDKTNTELKEVDAAIADLRERVKAAEDVLQRMVIRSPQHGVVTGLKYHTEGGVIPPGGSVVEIVPMDDDLIIDAKIPTRNIEEVLSARADAENIVAAGNYQGLRAKVRLSAYNIRKFGLTTGIVTQVSADAFTDPNGMRYYSLQVVIPKSLQSERFKDLKLYPGMPAEVFIVTRSRTLLKYLLAPITSTFEKAFKER